MIMKEQLGQLRVARLAEDPGLYGRSLICRGV